MAESVQPDIRSETPPLRLRFPWAGLVAQLFTALITVAAVYLAAKVGFEQTIRYTRYQEATDTLLILHVVRAELEENLLSLDEFGRYVDAMPETGLLLIDRVYDLRTQAFEGGVQNQMYFRLGPDVIVALRRFYDQAQSLRTHYTSNVKGRAGGEDGPRFGFSRPAVHEAWTAFKPHIARSRTELLPLIDRRVAELETLRKDTYGKDIKPVPTGPATGR